jgi:hypothetical protein
LSMWKDLIATQGCCVITNVDKHFEQENTPENVFGITYPSFLYTHHPTS